MTIQVAYTDNGSTGFVDVPQIDLYADAQTPSPNPVDIATWAQEVTMDNGVPLSPSDQWTRSYDRAMALRIENMAQSAGMTFDELHGIHAQSGLSWPALELLLAALGVQNWRYTRGG